ncbi:MULTISPECIES: heme lyase CcmF/NrfE family subunit [unclassified Janthinobacterium]|uniref:heme lyase CcmF/NrfE family subunit n=1 Tax=unclassified Janthinobacterium TaxID=2610881 RepID=UPI00088AC649|nr:MULTISPECIES: heme lyase CcmF/NrfE family subunit [unclassified Janthinobacterium]SDA53926.1 cytochrome c-type biogenesis protein CcmF [Janthinobacterium sp. 551a]SFB45271.1 cytochrome c-type biogenesis protein CcmF [Janthinobacterium sp. 344]
MISLMGNLFLVAATLSVCAQVIIAFRQSTRLETVQKFVFVETTFIFFAFGVLLAAFVINDFSITFIAKNSSATLPLYYRLAAAWGGHEGSLLLWVVVLAVWGSIIASSKQHIPPQFHKRVLGILGMLLLGFLIILVFTSNPFVRIELPIFEGRDLNPLLQDAGMTIHPPILYFGYIGMAVPFAYAIAALMSHGAHRLWVRWVRPWVAIAWSALTLGISTGAFWAYYELGWGGWWFWDPVENASLIPWLICTALLHSLSVSDRNDRANRFSLFLGISGFLLSLMGTFIVRSGIIASVHAFSSDSRRSFLILIFFSITSLASLIFLFLRGPFFSHQRPMRLSTLNAALLLNGIMLLSATLCLILGTLYPLIFDLLGLGNISVGPPYFESVFTPIMIVIAFLIGVGVSLSETTNTEKNNFNVGLLLMPSAISVGVGIAIWKAPTFMASAGLSAGIWIIFTTASSIFRRTRMALTKNISFSSFFTNQPVTYWGMVFAHMGIAVLFISITINKSNETSVDIPLSIGKHFKIDDYIISLKNIDLIDGVNFRSERATISLYNGNNEEIVLHPERRQYLMRKIMLNESAIHRGLLSDIYISLGSQNEYGEWITRIQFKPLMNWLWAGCLLMVAGGIIAACGRLSRSVIRILPQQDGNQ